MLLHILLKDVDKSYLSFNDFNSLKPRKVCILLLISVETIICEVELFNSLRRKVLQ